jgi:hypothetical protein
MNQLTPSNKFRIPTIGLIAIAGILIALIAIFVFKVAVGQVLYYGFFVAMITSHFWMHGGHGNHSKHQEQTDPSNTSNQLSPVPVENNDQQNRSHGCH